jgi:glutamine phosphoribosylpyrophosphate amidotransferase
MCSIIGYSGEYDKKLVERLMFNSRIRGLHSFGYSFFEGNELVTKKFLDYKKFIDNINKDKPTRFISHFRYSTSGEYTNQENNQPIVKDNTAMVFNGVIDMGSKKELEHKYKTKLTSCNDGELVLNIFNQEAKQVSDFIKNKTFAGLFLKDNKITVIKNRLRPCYLGVKNDIKVIASTKDILKRSGIENVKTVKPLVYNEL